jgi:hypothetical protein
MAGCIKTVQYLLNIYLSIPSTVPGEWDGFKKVRDGGITEAFE